jgi:hypothetical protein
VQVEQEDQELSVPQIPPVPEAQGVQPAASAPADATPAALADNDVAALLDLLDVAPVLSARPVSANPKPAVEPEAAPPPMSAPDLSPPASGTPPVDRPEPSGAHFMAWLHHGILARKLIINDAKALVHTVAGTAYLVSPGVFQRYAQEYLHVATLAKQEKLEAWQWVQKRFEKLGLHRKQVSGLNIWTCEVTGPRKSRRLHGYLLADSGALFQETPPDNPFLSLLNEAPKRENSNSGEKNNDAQ